MTDQHLIDLEIKIAHQEHAIEVLQQTAFEQHKTIEKLEKSLARLVERFEALTGDGLQIGPANEKPPHY